MNVEVLWQKMRKRNMSCTLHPSLLVAEHAGLEP